MDDPAPKTRSEMLRSTAMLAAFAVVGTLVLALTWEATRERIAENELAELNRRLYELVPAASLDRPLRDATVQVTAPEALGQPGPVTVYQAWRDGEIVAVVFEAVAPDGYSGRIRLLLGVRPDGRLTGVRVVRHQETPGLGDAIEVERSDWILGFEGARIGDPPLDRWAVREDGGVFDTFTGATITPRAVVGAVRRALVHFGANTETYLAGSETHEEAQDDAR